MSTDLISCGLEYPHVDYVALPEQVAVVRDVWLHLK